MSYNNSYLFSTYDLGQKIGEGSYGFVVKASKKRNCETVAIKILKDKNHITSWQDCLNLREVKILRRLNHPNIIKLHEVVKDDDYFCLVFEYMDRNLLELISHRRRTHKVFSESEIRNYCFQILNGLHYIHSRGCFHRDLKPDNVLVTGDELKIADFGLAREFCSHASYTDYVATLWYRAPETLLRSGNYGFAIDMWAVGAIMAELFLLNPIFGGDCEIDQLYKVCSVIGTPREEDYWSLSHEIAETIEYQFPQALAVSLSKMMPTASKSAIDIMNSLLSWNPNKRPTPQEALQHSFFRPCFKQGISNL
ncbi:cyclin-dependent kinase [Ranunculus cassubicifolius]